MATLDTATAEKYHQELLDIIQDKKELHPPLTSEKKAPFHQYNYVNDVNKDMPLTVEQRNRYQAYSPDHIQGENIYGTPLAELASGKEINTALLFIAPLDEIKVKNLLNEFIEHPDDKKKEQLIAYADSLTIRDPHYYELAAQIYTTLLLHGHNLEDMFRQEIMNTYPSSSLVMHNQSI